MSTEQTSSQRVAPTEWTGAIVFGACVLMVVGSFNVVQGLFAIFKNQVYVSTGSEVLLIDLSAWGWIHLLFGVAQIVSGAALFTGATWARVVVIGLVMVNAMTHMLLLPAFPLWSLLVIALDMIVLWAVTFHGAEMKSV